MEAAPTMEETPTTINGTSNGTNGHAAVEPEPVKDVTAGEDPKTYDDLFPSLPAGKPTGGSGGGNPLGEWNRKPKVASTTVTQVFVIPMEERKNQISSGGFGADDSYKHLKAVQEKTGAKIEMSSGKDQSLTFLITGKTDVVQRAKRELLREFQVTC